MPRTGDDMKVQSVVSANKVIGGKVRNRKGEDLGTIKDLMIDLNEGRTVYAVLTFGGFLGLGSKLFPVPWGALTYKPDKQVFILNVAKETLETAEGFDDD